MSAEVPADGVKDDYSKKAEVDDFTCSWFMVSQGKLWLGGEKLL